MGSPEYNRYGGEIEELSKGKSGTRAPATPEKPARA